MRKILQLALFSAIAFNHIALAETSCENDKRVLSLVDENMRLPKKHLVDFQGRKFINYNTVYSHKIFFGGCLQKKFPFQHSKGGTFLEIGAGSGTYAITALIEGAEKAVATDISHQSILNITENALRHNVLNKLDVRIGSVFEPISESEKFDTIFWNIPIGDTLEKKLSTLAKAVFDPGHKLLNTYINGVHKYLKPHGHAYVTYSKELGDHKAFIAITKQHNISAKVVSESKLNNITFSLYELTKLSNKNIGAL